MSQSFGGLLTQFDHDGQNRLTSISGEQTGSFTYDAYGSMLTAPGMTMAWDGVPNLVCVHCTDPVKRIDHGYDGLNQRTWFSKAGEKTYEMYSATGEPVLFERTTMGVRRSQTRNQRLITDVQAIVIRQATAEPVFEAVFGGA